MLRVKISRNFKHASPNTRERCLLINSMSAIYLNSIGDNGISI
ncbi:hypothetical protein APHWI1_1540 [Anaplasma phagocytophilum str. ApWI1]|uniref:Uncharacterized protein n=1 Tax=Anaplasma phagocytophilum str. ApWI1 TaxID=1359155 RepID=A0A0F3PXI8_ANAPH|nr:hypothetical protein APHWEB_1556 [Anaplasma phagocytophilum str. Webster]KJV82288.1 hypothetical protein APHHGE2_0759 [Anaplasma phagocytophilum str. HGE2]KJV84998.1 hypothetical protein APHWI1_1540 [Anaplasma phagocytophilum str. ApWI1]KJZ98119.1 hypothetical protein APHDU1_1282 [Anaplasma phagocytophilum]KKA00893.1 hypothetical protein APHCR_1513 [Anaplasma phagocytophilum str. CR1007]